MGTNVLQTGGLPDITFHGPSGIVLGTNPTPRQISIHGFSVYCQLFAFRRLIRFADIVNFYK